jgi:hypothetical protein
MKTDSKEENYFQWWAEELVACQVLLGYERAEPFDLSDSIIQPFAEDNGRRKNQTIFQKHIYTPDFVLEWNEPLADGLFMQEGGVRYSGRMPKGRLIAHRFPNEDGTWTVKSWVEVKPAMYNPRGGFGTKMGEARINIMWAYQRYGIFTNIVKVGPNPASLFDHTFTPNRFLKTDVKQTPRTIKFRTRSVSEFMNQTQVQHTAEEIL